MSVQDGAINTLNRQSRREMMKLNRGKTRKELVTVPEFTDEDGEPMTFEVRSLLGVDRAQYMQAIAGDVATDGAIRTVNWNTVWPLLPYMSTFDPDTGERIFESVEDVLQYDAGGVQRIIDAAQELSGINTNEEEVAGNV
jgi:hypothetical protein